MSSKDILPIIKKSILPIILAGLVVYFHASWLDFSKYLFSWDYLAHSKKLIQEFGQLYGEGYWMGYTNFGTYNIQPYHNIFKVFWGFLGDHNAGTILTVFIPILLVQFAGSYLFLKNVLFYRKDEVDVRTPDTAYSPWLFIGALYFCFNTYFLYTSFSHLFILFSLSLVPLLLYLFHRLLLAPNVFNMTLFVLFYTFSMTYELRMTIINTVIIIIFGFVYPKQLLNLFKRFHYILLGIGVFICLNMYWIVGVLQSEFKESAGAVINRGVFGNNLTNIGYGILAYKPYWDTNGGSMDFVLREIPPYLFLLPVFLLVNFFFRKKREYALLSWSLVLLGAFLLKQDAAPFTGSYTELYNNLPGFKLFREGSKFSIISILGYTIGLALFTYNVYNEKRIPALIKRLSFVFLALIILLPSLQLEKNGYTYRDRAFSPEYSRLNEKILKDDENYRILSLPYKSNLLDMTYKNPVIAGITFYKPFLQGVEENYRRDWSPDLLRKTVLHKDFQKIIYLTGTKYVVLPQDDEYNQELGFKLDYGSRGLHFQILKNGLKDFKHTKDGRIDYFESPSYLSHIFLCSENVSSLEQNVFELCHNSTYKQQAPTEYTTTVHGIKDTAFIGLSEAKSTGWQIGLLESDEWKSPFKSKEDWFTKEKSHPVINIYSINKNTFEKTILEDYKEILEQEGYPKKLADGRTDFKYFRKNLDGSIDIDLIVYYKPNRAYLYSLGFSAIAFIFVIGYLIISPLRNFRRKHAANT